MALSDAEWEATLGGHLARRVPQILPGGPALASVQTLADDVWLLELSDGGRAVAKHQFYGLLTAGQPYDLLQVEVDVLGALRRAGCPVPVVFGTDPEAQVIFLEYAGPRTLGHALGGDPPPTAAARRAWGVRLLQGLLQIEAALAQGPLWERRAVPGGSRGDLARTWEAVAAGSMEGFDLVLRALGEVPGARARASLGELARELGRRPPSLGATDYQPGNIVLDRSGQRLTFLELGKLGWDWTERRAVQYATWAPAPERPGLIEAATARAYGELWDEAEGAWRRRALDGHHLVFHLLWARRLCRAGEGAAGLQPLLRRLAAPLSDDPLAGEVRRRFAGAAGLEL